MHTTELKRQLETSTETRTQALASVTQTLLATAETLKRDFAASAKNLAANLAAQQETTTRTLKKLIKRTLVTTGTCLLILLFAVTTANFLIIRNITALEKASQLQVTNIPTQVTSFPTQVTRTPTQVMRIPTPLLITTRTAVWSVINPDIPPQMVGDKTYHQLQLFQNQENQ